MRRKTDKDEKKYRVEVKRIETSKGVATVINRFPIYTEEEQAAANQRILRFLSDIIEDQKRKQEELKKEKTE